jgi:hypothetical protein
MNIIESQGHRSAIAIENGSATALRVRRDNFALHSHRWHSTVAINKSPLIPPFGGSVRLLEARNQLFQAIFTGQSSMFFLRLATTLPEVTLSLGSHLPVFKYHSNKSLPSRSL